ncbi:hypothetical protein [Streptomyces sp. NPDC056682]|uniref:hypothetical protein n=1 Tax=Streptomyces sp. NPDC056682 TaxID=3345909 RepID=UPI0036A226FB
MLAATAGCGSGNDAKSPTPSASTPTAVPSKAAQDPAEAAKNEAIGTYQSYWQEMQRAYAKASVDGTDIKKYAAAAALRQAEVDTQRMHKEGQVVTGQVAVGSPTVTQVDPAKKVPNATVSSCLDISKWKVVEGATGKPVSLPADRRLKYVIVGTIEKWPDGWKVIKDEPQDKPC